MPREWLRKRPEKTLSLHFRVILGTERTYKKFKETIINKNNNKTQQPWEKESDSQVYVIRFKCQFQQQKNHKYKETGK